MSVPEPAAAARPGAGADQALDDVTRRHTYRHRPGATRSPGRVRTISGLQQGSPFEHGSLLSRDLHQKAESRF